MESVQGHLSGWLAHRLRTNATDHLTWMDDGSPEDLLNRCDQLIKTGFVEAILTDDLLGAEIATEENSEEHH